MADDGDTIQILGGTYDIQRTVHVDKLVIIQPDASEKVILKPRPGVTLFEVRAPGRQLLHVIIRDMTLGGNYKEGSTAPIFNLVGDSFTEITNNIIGGLDLPINNGIVIANSLHPNIHDNTFIGNTQTVFSPLLLVGRTVTGFGVVSVECLGQAGFNVSSEVIVHNNSFTNLWTSGVWLCSDGGGAHAITDNVFRNYWRGIAFKDVADSRIAGNTLVGGQSDGIILYGASMFNLVENNRLDSNLGRDAAGLRVGWIADPLLPLNNLITNNRILRATIAVHIFGAQTTVLTNNTINIAGARTAILLTTATRPLDPGTQPYNTEITDNTIIFEGACGAQFGCALRLSGVTVPVLATDNDWGRRTAAQVEGVIWHQYDDPTLGPVTFIPFANQIVPVTRPGAGPSPTATPANGTGPPGSGDPTDPEDQPGSGPPPGLTGSPTGTGTPTPTPSPSAGPNSALPSTAASARAREVESRATPTPPAPQPQPTPRTVPASSASVADVASVTNDAVSPVAGPATRDLDVERSLESVCVLQPDRRPCDAESLARWNGDLGAWQGFAARNRAPLPDEEAAVRAAIRIRLEAGDPPTKIALAQALIQPAIFLTRASFRTEEGRGGAELGLELANLGVAPVLLGGARVLDDSSGTLLELPAGAALAPGSRCRLSTGPAIADPCEFLPVSRRRLTASDPVPLTLASVTGERLDVLDRR